MSTAQERASARRLQLPAPTNWSVSEAEEARTCTGCRVVYQGAIRVVHAIHGCPAHTNACTKPTEPS